MDGTCLGLLRIAVMQERNVQRLTGVSDVMREHPGCANELCDFPGLDEPDHVIEYLPNTERQETPVFHLNRVARQDVLHGGVELVPLIRVNEAVAPGQVQ